MRLAGRTSPPSSATLKGKSLDRGGMVYDFLQERRSSASYTSQLDLVSTIRQDFAKLGALLADFTKEGKDPIERNR
jgi:hypothetical protein